jgi:hypothetical protein
MIMSAEQELMLRRAQRAANLQLLMVAVAERGHLFLREISFIGTSRTVQREALQINRRKAARSRLPPLLLSSLQLQLLAPVSPLTLASENEEKCMPHKRYASLLSATLHFNAAITVKELLSRELS